MAKIGIVVAWKTAVHMLPVTQHAQDLVRLSFSPTGRAN